MISTGVDEETDWFVPPLLTEKLGAIDAVTDELGVTHDKFPAPSVCMTWPLEPFPVGNTKVPPPPEAGLGRVVWPEVEPRKVSVPFTSSTLPGLMVPIPTFPVE